MDLFVRPSKWPKTVEPCLVSNHTTDYQGTKINWILLINTFAILYYLSLHVVSGLITGLLMYSAHFLFTKGKKREILFLSKYAPIQNTLQAKRMHFGWFLLLMLLVGLHSSLVMEFLKDENLLWWTISYKVKSHAIDIYDLVLRPGMVWNNWSGM